MTSFDVYCAECQVFGPSVVRYAGDPRDRYFLHAPGAPHGDGAGFDARNIAWGEFMAEHEYHDLCLVREARR